MSKLDFSCIDLKISMHVKKRKIQKWLSNRVRGRELTWKYMLTKKNKFGVLRRTQTDP